MMEQTQQLDVGEKKPKKPNEKEYRDACEEWRLALSAATFDTLTCVTPHTLLDLQPPPPYGDPRMMLWYVAYSAIMTEQDKYQQYISAHNYASLAIAAYNQPPTT